MTTGSPRFFIDRRAATGARLSGGEGGGGGGAGRGGARGPVFGRRGVGDDDDRVVLVDQVPGGAVHDDLAAAALALDGVGLEAGAVVDIEGGDLLVGAAVGRL